MAARRELQVFNFAFLDILTSTLGTLLFIFVLALINQFGLVEQEVGLKMIKEVEAAQTKAKAASEARRLEFEAETRNTGLAGEQSGGDAQRAVGIATDNRELEKQIATTEVETTALKQQIAGLRAALDELNAATKSQPGGRPMLPVAHGGPGEALPVHVDCGKDGLSIVGKSQGFCPKEQIDRANGPFQQLLQEIKPPSVLVLWVRPDGLGSFNKALESATKAGVAVGYEPALQDWVF